MNCGQTLTPVTTPVEVPVVSGFEATGSPLPYFSVATHKFVVMNIVTFGLYQYYWIYWQWRHIARTAAQPLSPFWRTFFAPFWAYSLFSRVRQRARVEEAGVYWQASVLAIAYFLLPLTWQLPDPWSLVSLLGFVPLIPVQRTIEAINARHAGHELPNRAYSGANVVGIMVGGGLLVLAVVAMFMKP